MILFIISFSLNLLRISEVPENAIPLKNPAFYYTPVVQGKGFEFSVLSLDIFKENEKIFSVNTKGETGFYFSDDLRYIAGIKKGILNFYKNGKFLKSFNINFFSGGHFSGDKFIARVEDGVLVLAENYKKFYKGLIDFYYLNEGVLKISPRKIWIEGKSFKKFLPSPSYIRKISVSENIVTYSTKNEIYIYDVKGDFYKKIKIKGSITSLYAGKKFVYTGILYKEESFIKVFDLKGNQVFEDDLGEGFISEIYKKGNKLFVLKDKKLVEFEIR